MKSLYCFLLCLLLPANVAFSNGMAGTEFWFGFMENQFQPQMSVVVSSTVPTSGAVNVPLAGWNQNFTLGANSSMEIVIPFNLVEALGNMSLENKGVHLTSNDPVFVSIMNSTGGSMDAASVLPIEALGYEYMAMTYLDPPNTNWGNPEILIVALEDNTVININLTGALSNGQTGPLTITLNQGQTYQVQSYMFNSGQNNGNDLSGSLIESICNSDGYKHKIAVFSGDLCSIVGGVPCASCDHLLEQMWPIYQLGTDFVVPAPVNRDTYILKVVASQNGTVVNISGQAPVNLNAGDWQQFTVTGDQTITSTAPISVGQFTKGQDCSTGLGDPFYAQIIPETQAVTEWQFFSYDSYSFLNLNPFDSYVSIVAPAAGAAPVFLDGTLIPPGAFQVIGNSRIAKLSIPSNASTHTLESTGGFTAYVYGYGPANSYNYNSGILSKNTDPDFEIAYLVDTTLQSIFDDTLCSCEPVTFISTFDFPGYEILWNFGDGQTGNGQTVVHDYVNGIYDVTMSIKDLSGCKIDSVIKLEIVIINCDISGPIEPICPGESVVLSSVHPAFTYLWSTGETTQQITVSPQQTTTYTLQLDGGAIPICDVFVLTVHEPELDILRDTLICETEILNLDIGPDFNNILWSTNETTSAINVNQPGEYTVQATDANSCDYFDTANVTMQAVPQWSIIGELIICEGESTIYEGPSIIGATYLWSTGENTQNISVSASANYQLTVDDGVCLSTNSIELVVIPSATSLHPDTIVCANTFTLSLPDLPVTDFLWSTGDVEHYTTVDESGVYYISINNQCEYFTDSVEVIFDCSSNLYVPNAFTPDGGGLNDVFYAEGYGIQEFEMLIFDRWGEIIFTSSDMSVGWDGTYFGQNSPIGVYVYKIKTVSITNITREHIGHVTLVR